MNASVHPATGIYPGALRDRHVLLWLIAGTGLLLLVALAAVGSLMQRAQERQALVNHALLVQTASERVRVALQRSGRVVMEALAADLVPDRAKFEQRRVEVFEQLDALQSMLGGNPGQVAHLALVRERISDQFDRLVALRPEPGPLMQQQIQQAQAGRSEIQQGIDAVMNAERNLLTEREAELEDVLRWHNAALVSAVLATLMLVFSTWWALRASIRRRDAADLAATSDRQSLRDERALLEQLVDQRTAELRWLVHTERLRNECAQWLLGSLGDADDAAALAGWRDRMLASGCVQRLAVHMDGLSLPPTAAQASLPAPAMEPGLELTLTLQHGLGVVSLLTRSTDHDDAGHAARQLCGDLGNWLQLRRERAARTRAERERDESAAQLSALFDQLPQPVVLHDANLRMLRVNAAFARVATRLGIQLGGQDAQALARARAPADVLALLRRAQQGEVVIGEPVARGEFRLLITAAPLRRPDGQLFGVVGNAVDVSELEDARLRLINMARRVMRIQEIERRSLALELHDDLGQRLAALKMNLGLLGPPLDPGPDQAIRDDSMRIVEGCIAQVRSRAASLRPALLDEMGLEAALRWHIADQGRRSGAAITLDADVPLGRSRGEWANHVYRIVQEALRNALEHGGARDIAVHLRLASGRVWLEVTDDGSGLPPDAMLRGNGLPGMRERSAMLGGQFETRPVLPHGTTVACHWDVAVTESEPMPVSANDAA